MESIIPIIMMIVGWFIALFIFGFIYRTVRDAADPDWALACKYHVMLFKELKITNSYAVKKRSLAIQLTCYASREDITPKLPEIYRLFERTDLMLTQKDGDPRWTIIEMPIKAGTPRKTRKAVEATATGTAPLPA